jgi:hypothetical protein
MAQDQQPPQRQGRETSIRSKPGKRMMDRYKEQLE